MKKIISTYMIFLLLAAAYAFSQTADTSRTSLSEIESDSTLNLMDLTPEDLETAGFDDEINELYEDDLLHMSSGFFPLHHNHNRYIGMSFKVGDVNDQARNISSGSIYNTGVNFGSHNPFSSDERDIFAPGKDEADTNGYPGTGYLSINIEHKMTIPYMPFLLKNSLGVEFNTGVLHSQDTSKSFLDSRGRKRSFEEAGVLHQYDASIAFEASMEIPIYGAIIETDSSKLASSYYFLTLGVVGAYSIYSSGGQYLQIADAKDALRYYSGWDTLRIQNDVVFDDVNRFRAYTRIGIGAELTGGPLIMSLGFYYDLPMTTVLQDAMWKQRRWCLSLTIMGAYY